MRAGRKAGALPLAAMPLTPGYFGQAESTPSPFILAKISPPEAQANAKRADLKQEIAP